MAIAVLGGFILSGILHALTGMYIYGIPVPVKYCAFFVVNGFVVAFEVAIRVLLKKNGLTSSMSPFLVSVLSRMYVIGLLFFLGHFLFWPDFNDGGATSIILKNGLACIGAS